MYVFLTNSTTLALFTIIIKVLQSCSGISTMFVPNMGIHLVYLSTSRISIKVMLLISWINFRNILKDFWIRNLSALENIEFLASKLINQMEILTIILLSTLGAHDWQNFRYNNRKNLNRKTIVCCNYVLSICRISNRVILH